MGIPSDAGLSRRIGADGSAKRDLYSVKRDLISVVVLSRPTQRHGEAEGCGGVGGEEHIYICIERERERERERGERERRERERE